MWPRQPCVTTATLCAFVGLVSSFIGPAVASSVTLFRGDKGAAHCPLLFAARHKAGRAASINGGCARYEPLHDLLRVCSSHGDSPVDGEPAVGDSSFL